MRRRFAILLVSLGLVAACGGSATPTPAPTGEPTPAPTDIFAASEEPSAAPEQSPAATPLAGKRYKVKKGDLMWSIAQKLGVSLAALKAANPKVDPARMRIGTILVIPAK